MTTRTVIATTVDVADDSTVLTTSNAELHGIHVNVILSAHACPIENAAGTAIFTLPATAAVGVYPCYGVFMDGITVDPNNAGTGTITVFWSLA